MELMDVFRAAERKVDKAVKAIADNQVTHELATAATAAAGALSKAVREAERVAITGGQKHGLAEIRAAVGGVNRALAAHGPVLCVTAAHETALADAVTVAKEAAAAAGATFSVPNLAPKAEATAAKTTKRTKR